MRECTNNPSFSVIRRNMLASFLPFAMGLAGCGPSDAVTTPSTSKHREMMEEDRAAGKRKSKARPSRGGRGN